MRWRAVQSVRWGLARRCARRALSGTRAAAAWVAPALILAAPAAMGGCEERTVNQSAIHPAGPGAQTIADLWWFLFFLLTGVFIATIALMFIAIFAGGRGRRGGAEHADAAAGEPASDGVPGESGGGSGGERGGDAPGEGGPPLGATMFVVVSGVIVPAVILVVLLFASLGATVALKAPDRPPALTVRVVGHMFWWHVEYPDLGIVSANQIRMPVGEPVHFELFSADVIHSFWVPNLSGKMDMFPDHVNNFWLRADRAGVYRGQCAEYCGIQHANMAFEVIAMEPGEFRAWAAEKARPPDPPTEPLLEHGERVFFSADAGCYACHAVAGTSAVGRLGPDLTHMGSRTTIGAGILANTDENLAAWIMDPQRIKPGNRMPGTVLSEEDLGALVAYLQSLR